MYQIKTKYETQHGELIEILNVDPVHGMTGMDEEGYIHFFTNQGVSYKGQEWDLSPIRVPVKMDPALTLPAVLEVIRETRPAVIEVSDPLVATNLAVCGYKVTPVTRWLVEIA